MGSVFACQCPWQDSPHSQSHLVYTDALIYTPIDPARHCGGHFWSSTSQLGTFDQKCWYSSKTFVPGHTAGCCVAPCLFAQISIKPSFLPEIFVNLTKHFYFSILDILVILFFLVHLCHWTSWLLLLCWAHSFEQSFLAIDFQWIVVLWLLVCW